MERLQSHQDKLSLWLSADPDHILQECGNILRLSEYKKIKEQPREEQQMTLLLRTIINNGEATCETFMEILRKNQGRYHQLQQFFTSDDSAAPTAFADDNSIVTQTVLSNVKTKSLTFNMEAVRSPRGNSPGNSESRAQYTATGGSVIMADRIDGLSADNINFSVNIKPSQVPSAPRGAADLPCQDPARMRIREHKVKLTECLMADPKYILQHVHQKSIVTDREYQNLKSSSKPEEVVTELLDLVINKSPEKCAHFLQLLKDPDVLETLPPLKTILKISA